MPLVLKPDGNSSDPEIYFLVCLRSPGEDDKEVGRVFNQANTSPPRATRTWFWGLSFPYYRGSKARHYGMAESKEDAMAQFKARWLLTQPD
jgi:hypothetical protein